jgi:ClpP class serine protease
MEKTQIEKFLLSTEWHIDVQFGLSKLADFLMQVELVKSGVSHEEIGFSEQRLKSREISILDPNTGDVRDKVHSVEDIPQQSEIIAKMGYSGVMRMEDGLCSQGIESFSEQLHSVSQKSNVSGILLYMNSGGGASHAGSTLNSVVADIEKPVVTVSPFLGSAAYMATAPSNKIILMGSNAMAGSIGTFLTINKKFIEEYSENFQEVYSSLSPNKNSVGRAIKENNLEKIVSFLDRHTEVFHESVMESRNLNPQMKEETLQGGMFTAKEAKIRGLADGVGGYAYALKRLQSEINYYQNR